MVLPVATQRQVCSALVVQKTVEIPQLQFLDLVVVPVVQRQASGPDSAALCGLTTSEYGWFASRADQFEGVRCPHEGRTERLYYFTGESTAVLSSSPFHGRSAAGAVLRFRGRCCAHTATSPRRCREVPQLPSSTSS